MKKIFLILLLFPLITFADFKVPQPKEGLFVNDYTNTLLPAERQNLLSILSDFNKTTSIQIAVVILNDFQGYSIEDITLQIGRTWGVGQKGLNNGIVYLISPQNRKSRIEVGSGLEGDLTDISSFEIQEKSKKFYKQQKYYEGITFVVENLINHLKPISWEQRETYLKIKEEKEKKERELSFKILGWIVLLIIIVVLIIILYNYNAKIKEKEEEETKKKLSSLISEHEKLIKERQQNYQKIETYKTKIKEVNELSKQIVLFEDNCTKLTSIADFEQLIFKLKYGEDNNNLKKALELINNYDIIEKSNLFIKTHESFIIQIKKKFESILNEYIHNYNNYSKYYNFIFEKEDSYYQELFTSTLFSLNKLFSEIKIIKEGEENFKKISILNDSYEKIKTKIEIIIKTLYTKNNFINEKLREIETLPQNYFSTKGVILNRLKNKYVSTETKTIVLSNIDYIDQYISGFSNSSIEDKIYFNTSFLKKIDDLLSLIEKDKKKNEKVYSSNSSLGFSSTSDNEYYNRQNFDSGDSSFNNFSSNDSDSFGGGDFSGGGSSSDSW